MRIWHSAMNSTREPVGQVRGPHKRNQQKKHARRKALKSAQDENDATPSTCDAIASFVNSMPRAKWQMGCALQPESSYACRTYLCQKDHQVTHAADFYQLPRHELHQDIGDHWQPQRRQLSEASNACNSQRKPASWEPLYNRPQLSVILRRSEWS